MKICIILLCLCLTACSNNLSDLEILCHYKDPNQMTDREVEMCKTFLQRPIVVQN